MAGQRRKKKAEPGFYDRFNALARAAEALGIDQTKLAATMGISGAQITRLRGGDADSIRFDAGLLLCERFGVDPWALAFGRTRKPPADALEVEGLVSDPPVDGLAPQYTPLADFQALQAEFARLREGLGGAASIAGESHQAVPEQATTPRKPGMRARRDRKGTRKAQ